MLLMQGYQHINGQSISQNMQLSWKNLIKTEKYLSLFKETYQAFDCDCSDSICIFIVLIFFNLKNNNFYLALHVHHFMY